MNQIAIISKFFTKEKFNLYKELYKNLPEDTLSNKLIKLRYINNLKREELSKILNLHLDTLEGWELHNTMPSPNNILKLSEFYKVPLEYFDEYYKIYFNNPSNIIKKWREDKKHGYIDICDRNAVEGKFGEGKIAYGLNRIAAKLKETSQRVIVMVFLVINLKKKLRVLLHLFSELIF